MTTTSETATAITELRTYIESLGPDLGVWVDGHGAAATGRGAFPVEDPATGATIAHVADATTAEAATAVDAAAGAFPAWATTAPRTRSGTLRRAFELMVAERDDLAALIAWENGKSITDARSEVTYAAEFFRWFAEEAVRTEGAYGSSPAGGSRTVVTHRPVGVAALVTPWNFPAAMVTRKIAPALAAGCTVVLKPAAETPLTALAIARLLRRAGAPPGVVNVVPSTDAAAIVTTWLEDPRVRKISFTGSTSVGKVLLKQAADRVVNSSMELGGNAAFVVGRDADIDSAVGGAMIAKLRNGGQACTAANRFYVHESLVEQFTGKLGAAVVDAKVGPAFDDRSQIGPLISAKALSSVAGLVEDAVAAGARITHQAPLPARRAGYFFPPTVLRDIPADAQILRTEIFGPVAPIVTWSQDAEMLRLVNDTDFGLAAYVYSRDLKWAIQTAEKIDAGMIGINRASISDPSAPFGGLKQSGIGREGAREGIREFEETQYLSIDWS